MAGVKKFFKAQMMGNQIVTEEILNKLHSKEYFNGDDILVGDQILYAMLIGEPIEKKGEDYPEIPISFISLNKRHFHLVEPYPHGHDTDLLPKIQLVQTPFTKI